MKNPNPPEFIVLYRWKIKPGMEDQFIEGWSQGTALFREMGSLGSRLHRGSDELWYGYAQWPSAEARSDAFGRPLNSPWFAMMHEAIEMSLPEIILEPISDFLVLPIAVN
ncbi:antibiotic biosynthesis monooxygenase [Undibacterium sp. FT79W]|uniref:antibiotic biosynthesis monooxygenase family protein n=1 Tax=Undibacterium sp. FT79W TaxID=2762296 RepID=UPI00164C18D5|nr:antibiotic biosynthesis monooxygenase [Undibacterium sp. FT79W]MBC3876844.1 antibiotic biosynthesis monooxygenase [Undibacterium sp. FT79W]